MKSLSLVAVLAGAATAAPSSWGCKPHPGSYDWPPQVAWNMLNQTVEGRLIAPLPPAGVCHEGQPNYAPDQCPALTKAWASYDFHAANPFTPMWGQFDDNTCDPDPKAPCSAAGYPAYVVDASSAEHAAAAVRFAAVTKVRLIVKSTGHDFLGRSSAPGSLSVWVHHLNSINYRPGAYKLTGSDRSVDGNFVVVGGGAQMGNIAVELDKYGQTIVGGQSKSVSVGGYITGGGHSALGPLYGMAADNVVEAQVVMPSGEIVTANEDVQSDLFWAIRGGGGSTFGVVTSFTIKTQPSPKVLSINMFVLGSPNDTQTMPQILGYAASEVPKLMDAGLTGYGSIGVALPNPAPGSGLPDSMCGFTGSFALFDKTEADWQAMLQPFNKTLQERFKGHAALIVVTSEYKSYLDWFNVVYDQDSAGDDKWIVSRLLDKKALTDEKNMGAALWDIANKSERVAFFLVAGNGVKNAKPSGGSDSLNPAWRNAYVHAISGLDFSPYDKAASQKTAVDTYNLFEPLRKLTPTSGAYVNEALKSEKNPDQVFWGSNYNRLLRIKREIDPEDVFWCAPCVGNNRWKETDDGKLCRA